MSSLADWFDPNSAGGILTVIFGFAVVLQVLKFFTALATTAPVVAGVAVFAIVFFAFLAWAAVRNGTFETSMGEIEQESRESDPLTVLKRRYARGELSEAEFERRVGTLLDTDGRSQAQSKLEHERV